MDVTHGIATKFARWTTHRLLAQFLGLTLVAMSQGHAAPFAYISNNSSNDVSVIDTASNTVTATVAVGTAPVGVAVGPTRVYVANYSSNNVSVIDPATNAVIATIPVGTGPFGVAVNPAGTRAYVANFKSHNVSVIDTATNAVVATIAPGTGPFGLVVNPAGTRLYVSIYYTASVAVIDTATNAVIATVPVGSGPFMVAVNPAGTKVYVTNNAGASVSVVDTASNTNVTTVPVGVLPEGVAVNPAGTRAYVANRGASTLSVIDTTGNAVIATVSLAAPPYGISINPTGTVVYVAQQNNNTVAAVDTNTDTVIATVPVGTGPTAYGLFVGGTLGGPTTVSLNVARMGAGTVTSEPPGIACGGDCVEEYITGTLVTLIATPDAGWVFSGWNGACSGTDVCTIPMSTARSVTATFIFAGAGSANSNAWVQKAYVAYYGRPADPAGLAYWASRMDAAGGSLSSIIAAFGDSDEFILRYGGLSYSDLIDTLYQQTLGRAPDPVGKQYYLDRLNAGLTTLQTITLDLLGGATGLDALTVANRLDVANHYTGKVAAGCPYGGELTGVASLTPVTSDSATALTAKLGIESRCGP
jgi:YVTN family beta-propeller protein